MRRAAFVLAGFISCVPTIAGAASLRAPTALVDTFIGTSGTPAGGPIDTFPGADLPFGMVQWSPDTPSQNAGGGYEYADRELTGFSLTHLSGPGCNVFGDFGILPVVGAVPSSPGSARQPFSHENEESAPGWYAVSVGNPAVRAELSVTARTGLGQFIFPPSASANLLFNVSSNQAGVTDATVRIDSPTEISGSASSGFFCGMPDQYTVYFVARFSRAFGSYGTWKGKRLSAGSAAAQGPGSGAWVSFDTTRSPRVMVKVGLSFVDAAGARANLDAEGKSWDLVAARNHATEVWNGMLQRISISGGTMTEQRTFYTALYHALLHPNLISDVTGLYRGFDNRVHHVRAGHAEYANYSDWDIYRTEAPLLALLAPGETSDMMQSLVDAAQQEGGWLPRWALVNGPTSVMGGDSIDPVIAGAFAFGARDFDARGALAAMVKGASTTAGGPGQGWYLPRWELNDDYLRRGYVVNTHTTSVSPGPNGASETIEYALDDFSIARLAFALHDAQTYAAFMRRSANWMTLFDGTAGWIAPRDDDGALTHTAINENGQSGFQEGNSAQYTWMIPQDLRDLVAAMGGTTATVAKLDEFFTQLDAGQDKPYAWLGNEPSLGAPWVYLTAGEPWRAQSIVRQALTTLYGDRPDGLPGNDDLGTMSAWYIWCAIGLYPQNPAVRYFDFGTPLFTAVTVRAPGGPTIEISSPRSSDDNAYVEALRVNGHPSNASWFALPAHGSVRLDVSAGAQANVRWASGSSDAPPSFATTPLSLPPATAAVFDPAESSVGVAAGGEAPLHFAISNRGGTTSASVVWRAILPEAIHLDVPRGRADLAAGAVENVALRLSTDSSLASGYYNGRVEATAANGALIAHLAVTVRVTRGDERPPLAYAENLFGNSVTPIDLSTGATAPEIRVGEEPRDAALGPDGARLYVANAGGGSISVVDTVALRTIANVKVGSSPNGIALTRDGGTLWVANADDGSIQSIDTHSLTAGKPIPVGTTPRVIAISPDGAMLYVANQGSNTITPIDLRTRTPQAEIETGARPNGLAIAPDGARLYVADGADNDVRAIDLRDGRTIARIPTGVDPMRIAVAPDGRVAYVTNYGNSTVTPIDLRLNIAAPPIEVGGAPYGIAISSNGRVAAIVSHRDNSCVLLYLDSGRVGRPIPLGIGPYTVSVP
ncbi:MAG TPA: GH92 family glycosyl hydrolase [Candidatus Cybelea sp.]|jgi:predicted alpha-1,2-mannosidase|nr:GH92 family glycosyl hydrolase [Candidatus Cybelea sp.]